MCEQIAVTYPATAPEVAIPELDGKTAKMYRYGNYNAYVKLLHVQPALVCERVFILFSTNWDTVYVTIIIAKFITSLLYIHVYFKPGTRLPQASMYLVS